MTEYEKRVAEGSLTPMNGMDWLLLQVVTEEILSGDVEYDADYDYVTTGLWDEIAHFYRNDPDSLNKLIELKNKFNGNDI